MADYPKIICRFCGRTIQAKTIEWLRRTVTAHYAQDHAEEVAELWARTEGLID